MTSILTGDKDQANEETAPAERTTPQRDGQGGGDTIPHRNAPKPDEPRR